MKDRPADKRSSVQYNRVPSIRRTLPLIATGAIELDSVRSFLQQFNHRVAGGSEIACQPSMLTNPWSNHATAWGIIATFPIAIFVDAIQVMDLFTQQAINLSAIQGKYKTNLFPYLLVVLSWICVLITSVEFVRKCLKLRPEQKERIDKFSTWFYLAPYEARQTWKKASKNPSPKFQNGPWKICPIPSSYTFKPQKKPKSSKNIENVANIEQAICAGLLVTLTAWC